MRLRSTSTSTSILRHRAQPRPLPPARALGGVHLPLNQASMRHWSCFRFVLIHCACVGSAVLTESPQDLVDTPSTPSTLTLSTVDEDDWAGHLTTADAERIADYRYRTPSPDIRYPGIGPRY